MTKSREGEVLQETMDTDSTRTRNSAHAKTQMESFLEDLGLEQHYKEKLSLSTILQINEKTITDEPAKCNSDLPWYFLKKLMMVNVSARNVKCTPDSACDGAAKNKKVKF